MKTTDPRYTYLAALELTPEQFEAEYSIPRGTQANMRWRKQGPRYRKVGRRVLYRRADIEAWLDRHTVVTCDFLPAT